MHIVWINQHASLVGGAEHYIKKTTRHVRDLGVRSTLLYDPNLPTSSEMLDIFDSAFPLADVGLQLNQMQPDLVFAHQIRHNVARQLAQSSFPVVNFLHDHYLFCLRETKYTTLGEQTCTRPVSASACYPCIGFVRRTPTFPRLRLRTISDIVAAQNAHKEFQAFVVASRYMVEQAATHGFDRERIHLAPLYADTESESSSAKRHPDRLLFVGGVLRSKGLDVLLNAFRHTTLEAQLDIVGTGPWMPAARKLVNELDIQNRVAFLGQKSPTELHEYYRRATGLVLPSRSPETFGLVGVEAMSQGTPVIASGIGGILEWLVPEQTGIAVPPNDSKALAAAIDRLIGDPALARAMGQAGRMRYRERFLPEHHIERLMGIFAHVLRGEMRS